MINKPQPGDYAPYAIQYIELAAASDDIIKLLTDLSESTSVFLKAIPADKINYAYAPGKWTVKEALGHMIDTERVFAYRAFCISRGEQQNLPSFEQDDYVTKGDSAGRDFNDLIAEFKALRLSNIYFLRSLTQEQADRVGVANGQRVSVSTLAYMMAGHELYHLNIYKQRYL